MHYLKFLPVAFVCISLVGCWSATEKQDISGNTNKSINTSTIENANKDDIGKGDNKSEVDSPKTSEVEKPHAELTPTEVLIAFNNASNAHNAKKFKQYLTKSSLELFEADAKKQGMTLDELIEKPSQMPTVESPKFRNEKIKGNTATVEAENLIGGFDEYLLIKENNVWKVAYDKFLKQKMEEINKGQIPLPKTN